MTLGNKPGTIQWKLGENVAKVFLWEMAKFRIFDEICII